MSDRARRVEAIVEQAVQDVDDALMALRSSRIHTARPGVVKDTGDRFFSEGVEITVRLIERRLLALPPEPAE